MSDDYETKRSNPHLPAKDTGGERPVVEDPLVELARIVQKNKQTGANVSSGRVGSTDYFAELEELSANEPAFQPGAKPRVEPTFGFQETTDNKEPIGFTGTETYPVNVPGEASPQYYNEPPISNDRDENLGANISSLWPRVEKADDMRPVSDAASDRANLTFPVPVYDQNTAENEYAVDAPATEATSLAPSVALDLEQNLTAELEDELMGVLRQSADETQADVEPGAAESYSEEPRGVQPDIGVAAYQRLRAADPQDVRYEPTLASFAESGDDERSKASDDRVDVKRDHLSSSERRYETQIEEQAFSSELSQQSFSVREPVLGDPRSSIDEVKFFEELNPSETISDEPGRAGQAPAGDEKLGGLDSIFADLDFPDPYQRKTVDPHFGTSKQEAQVPASETDIDDMTWPAAADAVPRAEEDETPPPSEGYDLDAVARAMQESDPSLTGSGVLPPHSRIEEAAAPNSREKSRRSVFVAAGVIGVAVLGGAGFFLLDGNIAQAPSGPPPVISGLQEPLKVFPEQQTAANNAASKLIYDRVEGAGNAGPERLVLPESPQPAELPPAPLGNNSGAELAPGSPKRVTTYKVLADGTIVSESESAAPSEPVPSVLAAPETAETFGTASEPGVASGGASPAPATPSTQPSVSASTEGGNQPEAVVPAPEVADVPSLVVPQTETPLPEPVATEPVAPVPSVLPRKKPAAPVQVASAPSAQASSSPTGVESGPLNLSQSASTPAAAAASAPSSGNIASGTYIVQVTSQRSVAAASDAYSGLQRSYPAILGDKNAVIVAADLGDRGVFYRARIPTQSREEANSLCESLQSAGGDCFVRRQP